MKWVCRLFGHSPVDGWCGSEPYFRIAATTVDGIGRKHAFLTVECRNCGEHYRVGNLHLPGKMPIKEVTR